MDSPHRKTGYTPSTWKLLDADVSGDAALLLLRLRRLADRDETDGHVEHRDLAALAAFHQLEQPTVSRCLTELLELGLIEKREGGYRDVEFLDVCRSAEERRHRRNQWKTSTKTYREKPHASSADSSADSAHSPSLAPSLALAPSQDALQEIKAEELSMPTQDAVVTIVKVWEDIAGRPAHHSEIQHVGWMIDQYHLLSPAQISEVLRAVHARETARGNVINNVEYFDGAVRDRNDSAKPWPEPEPVGDGEPAPAGNGHVSDEQLVRFRQQIAEMAARKGL